MTVTALHGFAADIGGTKTAVARIEAGRIVARDIAPTDCSLDLAGQLDRLARLLGAVGYAAGAPLGVAVAGLLSREGRWSAVNRATFPAISDAPLADALRARFGVASCLNDALAATLAEHRFGAGRGCRDFVYLTVSTGVGGGIVADGRLATGRRGLAGHFGFSSARAGRDACGSGRLGTVESVASGRAIEAAAAAHGAGLSPRDVFAAAAAGQHWAAAIIDRAAETMATLCADICAILDPERIALGGGVGAAPGFLSTVERFLAREPALFVADLKPAALGADAPLFGALASADGSSAP
jgi:N-acylmannosamine kinase